jgi:hypothetical protein
MASSEKIDLFCFFFSPAPDFLFDLKNPSLVLGSVTLITYIVGRANVHAWMETNQGCQIFHGA